MDLEDRLGALTRLERELDDATTLVELGEAEGDEGTEQEGIEILKGLKAEAETRQIETLLSGEADANDTFIEVHSGAGGTESCDWARMLERMYTRWAERRKFSVELIEETPGEEAGIKSATLLVKGHNAHGWMKSESGVHRLVRISPFDSNKRRHTSFCAVDVVAEITEEIEIEIPDSEIRTDVYRSSGKGGQGVNTTDSAVRLTHIPSGIVVVCQNERSQIKNRATAMNVLKSRLYEKKQDEQRAEMDKFYGEKGEIGWGSQIRSYVLQPYQMVKDLRTGISTSDTQGVLDGDLDRFVNAWLRAGSPRHRNKEIQMEE